MTKKEKLINQVIDDFNNYRGKACTFCFQKSIIPQLIVALLTRFYAKHQNGVVLAVTDSYKDRKDIYYAVKEQDFHTNHKLSCITMDYVNPNYGYAYDLSIIVTDAESLDKIKFLTRISKFVLCIITNNKLKYKDINELEHLLPFIKTVDFTEIVNSDRIYSPVEEVWVGVELSDEDRLKYDDYCKFIANAIRRFKSLDNINKCRSGDISSNISANEFCLRLAYDNGWHEHLDMTLEYQRSIDDIYNPISLKNDAEIFFNIAKSRRDLLINNEAKIKAIVDIVNDNDNKKILIVCKNGDFAHQVFENINTETYAKCGEYHDDIEPTEMYDDNGVIRYKSGVNKGKPKIFKSQAISSLYEREFSAGNINVLSIKNSSSDALCVSVDMIIFASPMLSDITDFRKRFKNVNVNIVPTPIYKIYCQQTLESEHLFTHNKDINIKNIDMGDMIKFDENNNPILC